MFHPSLTEGRKWGPGAMGVISRRGQGAKVVAPVHMVVRMSTSSSQEHHVINLKRKAHDTLTTARDHLDEAGATGRVLQLEGRTS